MTCRPSAGGFSLVELLIAMAVSLAIIAAALALAQAAHPALRIQLEAVDITQRLRAAADALSRDMLMAGSGLPAGVDGVSPYTAGASERGLTVRYVPSGGAVVATRSYYVRNDVDASLWELRRSDGDTDVPVVDHVASAVFSCFDIAASAVPECGDAARIRRIRVVLRVQAVVKHMRVMNTMLRLADEVAVVDIAPRTLRGGG